MGGLIRNFNWSKTPLGAPDTWPVNLLTTLGTLINSSFPMFLWWGDEMIQFYNDAYRPSLGNTGKHPAALGATLEESWGEILHIIQPMIEGVKATGIPTWSQNQLVPIYRNNRLENVYWTFSYSPVKDETGSIGGILVICQETTAEVENKVQVQQLNHELTASNRYLAASNKELRNVQTRLQSMAAKTEHEERRFRSLIEQIPTAVSIFTTRDLIVEFANDKMLELWGRTAPDVMNKPLLEAMPELTGQPFMGKLDDVLTTGITYYSRDEKALILRNGRLQECYFNIVYQPVINADSSISSLLQVATEVTKDILAERQIQNLNEELAASNEELSAANEEQSATNEELAVNNEELRVLYEEMKTIQENLISANRQLAESEEKLRLSNEAAGIGNWSVEASTGKITATARYYEIFGLNSYDKTTIDDVAALVQPLYQEQTRKAGLASMTEGKPYTNEFSFKRKNDGAVRWARTVGMPKLNDKGQLIVFTGVTMDITEQKQDEQRKYDFIGMVSHELKTPLTSLAGYLDLVKLGIKHEEIRTIPLLEKAGRQVGKMTTMINGFLNVSRLESGKLLIEKTRFDMALLLQECEDEIKSTTASHRFIFSPVEETIVSADKDKIGHVVYNLLANAVKYSAFGSTVHVACVTINGRAEVSVKDEGIGIAAEDKSRLFERFYRAKSSKIQSVAGFGIGLYLCAEIISRHEGTIWVESKEGEGSTFFFNLPVGEV